MEQMLYYYSIFRKTQTDLDNTTIETAFFTLTHACPVSLNGPVICDLRCVSIDKIRCAVIDPCGRIQLTQQYEGANGVSTITKSSSVRYEGEKNKMESNKHILK